LIQTITAGDQFQPFWIWPAVFVGIAVVITLLWLFDRIGKRHFPSIPKTCNAGGHALIRMDAILQPSRQYLIEARERQGVSDDASGDPPKTGTGRE
jgi:hypothetical protein